MLARELGGEPVDRAEAPDRDQEGLVRVEPGGLEIGDLLAQMAFELVRVGAVDHAAAQHGGAPLPYARLQVRAHAPTAGVATPQSPPSVRVAVSHCLRCSAS